MENERNHQCRKCGGIGTPSKALAWWNSLTSFQRSYFKDLHFDSQRSLSTLTGREIEDIWLKETAEKGITITDISKQNQKQFKKFDESLFRAYINKFSDEDKVAALRVLFKSIGITSKDKLEYFLARY